MGGDIPERLTVSELAALTDVSVRNIRAHQSRGLLPPPEVRGRTAYYSRAHLERLRLIRDLQQRRFNLAAIGWLLQRESRHAPLLLELQASESADAQPLVGHLDHDLDLDRSVERQ